MGVPLWLPASIAVSGITTVTWVEPEGTTTVLPDSTAAVSGVAAAGSSVTVWLPTITVSGIRTSVVGTMGTTWPFTVVVPKLIV